MRLNFTILGCALLVAACASPQQQCISDAQKPVTFLRQQVAEVQSNVSRGYAVTTKQEVVIEDAICPGVDSEGNPVEVLCQKSEVIDHEVPVPINLSAERAKLADLQSRLAVAERKLAEQIAQCQRSFPE